MVDLLALSFQLIKNEVDGGIHIFRDFAGGNVDAVTGKLNFHALAELIDRHIHLRIKSGILAEESSQLLHTAAGIRKCSDGSKFLKVKEMCMKPPLADNRSAQRIPRYPQRTLLCQAWLLYNSLLGVLSRVLKRPRTAKNGPFSWTRTEYPLPSGTWLPFSGLCSLSSVP